MKPIKIIISAFGSYADKTEINFEKVNSGIFLIAGDTGAGKTTIFDAITYALYEQTSGGVRDGNMMRSQFADDDTPTYVELTFKYQDKIYKITRNPQYERRSKRKTSDGSGYTTELPKVELVLPNGKVFIGKKTETNNKITEILGIDREQFTQIAMIAQGDFLKLLHANSDERKRIFSKIFDTKIYGKIQESLQNKIREINTELAKNKTLCEHELKNITCLDESIYKDQWMDMIYNFEFKTDSILESLDKINSEIKDKEIDINSKKDSVQGKLNNIISAINNAETINALFKKLKFAHDVKANLDGMAKEQNIKEKRLNDAKKAERVKIDENKYVDKSKALVEARQRVMVLNSWLKDNENALEALSKHLQECEKNKLENEEKLTGYITRIEDTLPKYDDLKSKKDLESNLSKEKSDLEKSIDGIKKYIDEKKEVKLKLEKEQEQLKNCYAVFTEAQLSLNNIENRVVELDELYNLTSDLTSIKKKYDMSVVEARDSFKSYSELNDLYEQMYRAFLNEQAGILAKERLMPNMPCPVCGSTNHPNIASVSEYAPSQLEIEKAKKDRDKAEKQNSISNEKLQVAKQSYELKLEIVSNKAKQIFKKDKTDESTNYINARFIAESLEKAKKDLEQSKNNLKSASHNVNKYETNIKELELIQKELNDKTTNLDEVNKNYNELNIKITTLSTSIEELKKQLLFDVKEEAVKRLNMYRDKLKALNDAVLNATNKFSALSKEIEAKKGQQISEIENGTRIKAELEETKNAYYNAIDANEFESEEEYKNSKLSSAQIESLQSDIDGYKKRLSDVNNEIRIYTEQTEGKSEIVIDNMIKIRNDLMSALQEIEREFKVVYALDKKNFDAKVNIEKLFKERKVTREQYEIYDSLNKTANGKISENVKMDFETYVQRQYFNMIISAANKRLNRMSSGQFLLQCRDISDLGNRGPVGLDLDVYSLVTDTTRDIKTLSGGESFMAALSMALGLSDVIQSTAGAVHLDTMFIDEGFGSLDDNSRAQAINVLNELAGNSRLIGIISHVSELKEQIENKLLVKKSEKGSKVYWSE